ncbi:MAG: ferritin family protein [Spirochaetales bacterium]|nr:ferritin family protein [Spirochaetales bacterium]
MEILKYALQFELDGERFYRESAAGIGDPHLADILQLLAKEEQKHYRMIKDLRRDLNERPASIFISDITNIFRTMIDKKQKFVGKNSTITEIFEKALHFEDESIRYYAQKAQEIDDANIKILLEILKKQEQAHYSLISSLIEYYEKPRLWMEQAEFTHLDEY